MSGKTRALVCVRDLGERTRIGQAVCMAGFDVSLAGDLDAIAAALRAGHNDVLLLAHDPEAGMDAIGFLGRMHQEGLRAGVVVLAVRPKIEDAISSMRLGAVDYVLPPWTDEVVGHAATHAVRVLAKRNSRPSVEPVKDRNGPDRYQILTKSPVMERVLEKARQVARSAAPVLIEGGERDRQGAPCPFHTPGERPGGRTVLRHQLRRPTRDPARKRAFRARKRGIFRSHCPEDWALREGQRRDPSP